MLRAQMDLQWPVELPFEAADEARLISRHEELPWIQYHSVGGVADAHLSAVWLVTWDNMMLMVLVGSQKALAKWSRGAIVNDAMGRELGALGPVAGRIAKIVAPGGMIQGQPASCFLCDLSLAKLKGSVFTISQLAEQGIQLLPLREEPIGPQELIHGLVLSNYPSEFLRQLPEHVDPGPDSLTLNAYLRLLLRRSCIPRDDAPYLLELNWLAEDLRSAFQRLTE
ncbi:hypothetical protein ACFL09_00980 [Planctomycetota bacterium]